MTEKTPKERLEELKALAKQKGFEVTLLDRGANYRTHSTSDRYEIWLEGSLFQSKISYRPTLGEAVDEAFPLVIERMKTSSPGTFND